jgi:hypothetical protein
VFSVGRKYTPAGMTVRRCILFVYIIPDYNPGKCSFILEHVDELPVRPGVQSLVELITVIDALTDTAEVPDGYLPHTPLHTLLYKVGCGYMKEILHLKFFSVGYLPPPTGVLLKICPHLLPVPPQRLNEEKLTSPKVGGIHRYEGDIYAGEIPGF